MQPGARAALLLSALAIRSFAQSSAEPQYEGSLGPATYSGRYVLDWDSPAYTHVSVYGPDAKLAYSDDVRSDGACFHGVWALDSDGAAARACEWRNKRVIDGRIELLDHAGKPVQTIGTGSYQSQHMVFAPDHTLWTIGFEGEYESRAEDFNVVHHYAQSGEEIGQGLPWLQIAGDYNAYTSLQLCLGLPQLFAAADRIGFTPFSTEAAEAGSRLGLLELSLENMILAAIASFATSPWR